MSSLLILPERFLDISIIRSNIKYFEVVVVVQEIIMSNRLAARRREGETRRREVGNWKMLTWHDMTWNVKLSSSLPARYCRRRGGQRGNVEISDGSFADQRFSLVKLHGNWLQHFPPSIFLCTVGTLYYIYTIYSQRISTLVQLPFSLPYWFDDYWRIW